MRRWNLCYQLRPKENRQRLEACSRTAIHFSVALVSCPDAKASQQRCQTAKATSTSFLLSLSFPLVQAVGATPAWILFSRFSQPDKMSSVFLVPQQELSFACPLLEFCLTISDCVQTPKLPQLDSDRQPWQPIGVGLQSLEKRHIVRNLVTSQALPTGDRSFSAVAQGDCKNGGPQWSRESGIQ